MGRIHVVDGLTLLVKEGYEEIKEALDVASTKRDAPFQFIEVVARDGRKVAVNVDNIIAVEPDRSGTSTEGDS